MYSLFFSTMLLNSSHTVPNTATGGVDNPTVPQVGQAGFAAGWALSPVAVRSLTLSRGGHSAFFSEVV